MAIDAGSIVALKAASSALTFGFLTAQPPVFGVAEGAAGGAVNWYNGLHTSAVASGQLDEIVDPNVTTQELIGEVVTIAGYSSAYNSVVVGAYNRNATTECVLLKLLSNGAYLEVDATLVTVVAGL